MNAFLAVLKVIIKHSPAEDNHTRFAELCGVDKAHLHRVLSGKFSASPEFVGRVCGGLTPDHAATLLKAYLDLVSHAALTVKTPPSKPTGWRSPAAILDVEIATCAR